MKRVRGKARRAAPCNAPVLIEARVKLLHVLQDKKVRCIGEKGERTADVCIVAVTNRGELLDEVATARFREDLYNRLGVLLLKTLALRDRQGDLLLLIERRLEKLDAERPGGDQKEPSPQVKSLLLARPHPGSVREFHSALLRAFVRSPGTTIDEATVREGIVERRPDRVDLLGKRLGADFELRSLLADVARHYLERALTETHGNKTKAAALIGFSNYQTLTNWPRKHGVET